MGKLFSHLPHSIWGVGRLDISPHFPLERRVVNAAALSISVEANTPPHELVLSKFLHLISSDNPAYATEKRPEGRLTIHIHLPHNHFTMIW